MVVPARDHRSAQCGFCFDHSLGDAGAGIDGDGLLHEDVFASVHCGFEMIRTEAGRRGEDDDVAAFDDFLVGIWAGEDAGVIDFHLLRNCG